MRKAAFYFSHDSNAKDDPKCSFLIEQLGLEGYGIFWVLVETLRDQPNYRYPLAMIQVLARKYNTTGEKIKVVIGNYGLFVIDNENFFSMSLCKRMELMENIRAANSIKGLKSAAARKKIALLNSGSTPVNTLLNKENKVQGNELNEENEKVISADATNLSNYLRKRIKEWNSDLCLPDEPQWAACFMSMIYEDGREPDMIAETIKYATESTFWQKTIISAAKVRKHYNTLASQIQKGVNF